MLEVNNLPGKTSFVDSLFWTASVNILRAETPFRHCKAWVQSLPSPFGVQPIWRNFPEMWEAREWAIGLTGYNLCKRPSRCYGLRNAYTLLWKGDCELCQSKYTVLSLSRLLTYILIMKLLHDYVSVAHVSENPFKLLAALQVARAPPRVIAHPSGPLRGLLRQKHDETYDVTIWREIQTTVSSLQTGATLPSSPALPTRSRRAAPIMGGVLGLKWVRANHWFAF